MKLLLPSIRKYTNDKGLTRSPDNLSVADAEIPIFELQPKGGAPYPADRNKGKNGPSIILSAFKGSTVPYGRADHDWLYERAITNFWIRAETAREAEEFYYKFIRSFNNGCYPYGLVADNLYISSIRPDGGLDWYAEDDPRGYTGLFSMATVIAYKDMEIEE